MELIISSGVLTILLLVGAFADFLFTPSSRHRVYHGEAFSGEPKRTPAVDLPTQRMAQEYDRAA